MHCRKVVPGPLTTMKAPPGPSQQDRERSFGQSQHSPPPAVGVWLPTPNPAPQTPLEPLLSYCREEEERSEVLRLMVAEGRVRMDIKGEEEQEGYPPPALNPLPPLPLPC